MTISFCPQNPSAPTNTDLYCTATSKSIKLYRTVGT